MYTVSPQSPDGFPEVLQGDVNWLVELGPEGTDAARGHLELLRREFPGDVVVPGSGGPISFALGDPRFDAYPLGVVASMNGEVGILIRHLCTGTSSIDEAQQRLRSVVFDFGESTFFVENLVPQVIHMCAFVPCIESMTGRFTNVYNAIGITSGLVRLEAAIAAAAKHQIGVMSSDLALLGNVQLSSDSSLDFCA